MSQARICLESWRRLLKQVAGVSWVPIRWRHCCRCCRQVHTAAHSTAICKSIRCQPAKWTSSLPCRFSPYRVEPPAGRGGGGRSSQCQVPSTGTPASFPGNASWGPAFLQLSGESGHVIHSIHSFPMRATHSLPAEPPRASRSLTCTYTNYTRWPSRSHPARSPC